MNPPPHVLVARLDNAGDVVLTGPAVRAVAAGARQVTFLCSRSGLEAAELLPGVDRVVEIEAPWVAFDPPPVEREGIEDTVDRIAALGADQAVILTSFHQSPLPLALLLRMAGVPVVAATCVDYPGSLLDLRHHVVGGAHEVEQALSLVARLGYRLPDGDDGRLRLRDQLPSWRPFTGSYVVVHPGASVPARGIPAPRARDLVELLVQAGRRVAITGGRAERALTAEVAAGGGAAGAPVVDLGGVLDLAELAGVLDGAAAVVAGNTGPVHLAAAVGTPVVSVFAPVVPIDRWRPWGVPHLVLGDQHIDCAGCRSRSCPVPGQPCIDAATAPAMAAAVAALAPVDDQDVEVVPA